MKKNKVTTGILLLTFGVIGMIPVFGAIPEPMEEEDSLILTAGDRLNIQVDRYKQYSGIFTISEEGTLDHSLIGTFQVEGRSLEEVREDIIDRFSLYLKRPVVTVEIIPTQYVSPPQGIPQIYLFGEVQRPGAYDLTPGMTFLQLIASSGGVYLRETKDHVGNTRSPGANIRNISIFRANGDTIRVDLEHIQQTGDQTNNVVLESGDTIFIPAGVQGNFTVFGLVRRAGSYPYPVEGKLNLMEALVKAGGFAPNGSLKNIRIVRTVGGDPQTFNVNLWDTLKAGRLEMIPEIEVGDVIFVTYTPFYYWERLVSSVRQAAAGSESVRIIRDFNEGTAQDIRTNP